MSTLDIISNGHGEDMIAATIVGALEDQPIANVFPLVGNGAAFTSMGITPTITQPPLPSGGFVVGLNDFLNDIRAGFFGQFWRQSAALRQSTASAQLVVGDVYALFMATRHTKRPTVFFPTAKSERAIPHYAIERLFIKSKAQLVFPRDIETHRMFQSHGIRSRFFGNPMFDHMVSNAQKQSELSVALLPGSRNEGIGNIGLMLDVIDQLNLNRPADFCFALPKHFDEHTLAVAIANRPWVIQSSPLQLQHAKQSICIQVSHSFFDVLQAANVVIGLAGTANEQAMHAKRQLISFVGTGPQSNKQRFLAQHQLIDGVSPVFIDSSQPSIIANQLRNLFSTQMFPWTPLSDHFQSASTTIAGCLMQELL